MATLAHLAIDPRDPRPLWRQIEEGVLHAIAAGRLARGESLPSVRDLARSLRVNPATIARAYQRLADSGLVTSRRGEGTFVADSPPGLTRRELREQLLDAARNLARRATALGAERAEAVAALDEAMAELLAVQKEPT